jgi:hypothetical protein
MIRAIRMFDDMSLQVSTVVHRAYNLSRRILDRIYYQSCFRVATKKRGRSASALVIPQQIPPMYTIWKICMLLGLRITTKKQEPCEISIFWEDTTNSKPPIDIPGLLNAKCTDIGKNIVEERFAEIFGYPLAINPAIYKGPYVTKARLNFAHNGRVLSGTINEPDKNAVYQKLVDNRIDEGWQVIDIRTAIVGKQIPIVFVLYRSITDRFGTDSSSCELISPEEIFNPTEISLILTMAKAMGLDFGELDILRDAVDGRIYVVDVNKTPVGPPRTLTLSARHHAMRLVANAFAEEFLNISANRLEASKNHTTNANANVGDRRS